MCVCLIELLNISNLPTNWQTNFDELTLSRARKTYKKKKNLKEVYTFKGEREKERKSLILTLNM